MAPFLFVTVLAERMWERTLHPLARFALPTRRDRLLSRTCCGAFVRAFEQSARRPLLNIDQRADRAPIDDVSAAAGAAPLFVPCKLVDIEACFGIDAGLAEGFFLGSAPLSASADG
jgi:hypothetical protein